MSRIPTVVFIACCIGLFALSPLAYLAASQVWFLMLTGD